MRRGDGLPRALLPWAAALSFAGLFPTAVVALAPAQAAENLGYVLLVELCFAASCLGAVAAAHLRREREIGLALREPLAAETPRARGPADAAWRALVQATRERAALEAAERAARSAAELDDLLASIHALKTPATALSLMADRSEREGEPLRASEARLEIDELGRAVDRCLARLRLVDFDRGSRMRRFDASALARDSLRRHRRLFIARGVSASVEGSFEADSDPEWISFILDQLVSNAAKHASASVSVKLAVDEAGSRPTGAIEVADDGPGLDPEEAARAFGRSAAGGGRPGAPSAAAPSPSGYGLYLAREAAERLGAALALAEPAGGGAEGGARFRLTLPLSPGPLGDRNLTPT